METILQNEARRAIVNLLLKEGIMDYTTIAEEIKDLTTRPDHHLSFLVKEGILRKKGRGKYATDPKVVSVLRKQFSVITPITVMGGLGKEITLYTDLLDALEKYSIIPSRYVMITSPEIKKEFEKSYKKPKIPVEILVFDYQEVLRENLAFLQKTLTEKAEEILAETDLICDLTGGTKPTTVALLQIAYEYHLQSIYFSGKKILWVTKK